MDALNTPFFARQTSLVARELLGQHIVSTGPDGGRVRVRIVETEAYLGPEDPGSHAGRGRHTQAHRLWGPPGVAYVYICYGIHQMLNVAAHAEDAVGAVLFRAAEPLEGIDAMAARRGQPPGEDLAAGPGKLAEALGVTRQAHDGVDLTQSEELYLAPGGTVPQPRVQVTGRIGLSQGGDRLLRFVDAASPALSRPPPGAQGASERTLAQAGPADERDS